MVGWQGTVLALPGDVPTLVVPALMALLVTGLLWTVEVPVTRRVVLSLAPWAVVGAGVHALYAVDAYDPWADPFFGPVAVYFSVFTLTGMVWTLVSIVAEILDEEHRRDAQYLAAAGGGAALAVFAVVVTKADTAGFERIAPAFGGLMVTILVAAGAYLLANVVYPTAVVKTKTLGFLVVLGHTLHAVMIAASAGLDLPGVGLDEAVLGTNLNQQLVAAAAGLPGAEAVGAGWYLVVARVVLAFVVLGVFGYALSTDRVSERPAPTHLLLGVVAAVGLWPGVRLFFTMLIA